MQEEHIRKLLRRGHAYLGMIGEIRAKAKLLKGSQQDPEIIEANFRQMKKDMSKYSRKVIRIYEELGNYGCVEKLE